MELAEVKRAIWTVRLYNFILS